MPNVTTVHELSKRDYWQHQRSLIAKIARHDLYRGTNGRDTVYTIGTFRMARAQGPLDAEQVTILIDIGYVTEDVRTITRYLDVRHKEPVTLRLLHATKQGLDFMRATYAPRNSR